VAYDNACICDRYRTNTLRWQAATPWVVAVWIAHTQAMGLLDEAKFAGCNSGHTYQHETVAESRNVRRSVDTLLVMHGYIANLEMKTSRTKEQVEVTEWIKITEVGPLSCNSSVIV
jgi:hypothetical protein